MGLRLRLRPTTREEAEEEGEGVGKPLSSCSRRRRGRSLDVPREGTSTAEGPRELPSMTSQEGTSRRWVCGRPIWWAARTTTELDEKGEARAGKG